jgi:DtxR family Mn-dependent transcriptional regulator
MLEHQTSDFLADKIEVYLGNPVSDPHGDPIPDNKGKIVADASLILLSEATEAQEYKVGRIFSSEESVLEFCETNNIKVGTTIKVEKQFEQSKMTEIQTGNSRILLNKEFTDIIYLKK